MSDVTMQLDIKNEKLQAANSAEENLCRLKQLHTSAPAAFPATAVSQPVLTPDYIVSLLPSSVFARARENLIGWEPVAPTLELQSALDSLDRAALYDLRSLSVIYVPHGADLSTATSAVCPEQFPASDRFEGFLSKLGTLVDVRLCPESVDIGGLPRDDSEGVYGISWKDEVTQVFFHVNTLLMHEGSPERVLKHINKNSVAIVWNESGCEVPPVLFASGNLKVFIQIVPLPTGFCRLTVSNFVSSSAEFIHVI